MTTDIAPAAKKNADRLSRRFRKHKGHVTVRPWRLTAATPFVAGVPTSLLLAAVGSLTEEERGRAARRLDPLSVTQEELLKRAARFGVATAGTTTTSTAAEASVVDEAMKRRMERFGTSTSTITAPLAVAQDPEVLKAREERFRTALAPPAGAVAHEPPRWRVTPVRSAAAAAPTTTTVALTLTEADREAMERRQKRFAC